MIQMVNRHDNGVCLRSDRLHVEITLERKEMGLFDDVRNMMTVNRQYNGVCLRSDRLHVEITLERKEMGLFDDVRNMIRLTGSIMV